MFVFILMADVLNVILSFILFSIGFYKLFGKKYLTGLTLIAIAAILLRQIERR